MGCLNNSLFRTAKSSYLCNYGATKKGKSRTFKATRAPVKNNCMAPKKEKISKHRQTRKKAIN